MLKIMQGPFLNKNTKSQKFGNIVFFIILLSISVYYGYHSILFKRPQSVHYWRQSDCASITLNYYKHGLHFFRPQTHNLTSDGGTTGYCATSELPIIYYSVALLYKVFGYHEFILRLVNTLLFFLGLFYLFKLFKLVTGNLILSTVFSLLFFTSPVMVFYGNNFMTDVASWALLIIGLYHFFKFQKSLNPKNITCAFLFFLFAGWIKITMLICFIALGMLFMAPKIKSIKGPFFNWHRKQTFTWLSFILVMILIGAWTFFSIWYNKKHDCTYFSTTIFPIWTLKKEVIASIIQIVKHHWLKEYFHGSALIFFLTVFLSDLYLIITKKIEKRYAWLLLLVFMGSIAYILLWFLQFANHDYYIIPLMVLPLVSLFVFIQYLQNKHPKILLSVPVNIAALLFLFLNIIYSNGRIEKRYSPKKENVNKLSDLFEITPILREAGIKSDDTVIYITDKSHASLYLMDQRGWTTHTDARYMRSEPVRYNQDSLGIIKSIRNGAQYLIIENTGTLLDRKYLQSFAAHLTLQHNETLVFDLKNSTCNYTIPEPKLIKHYFCDAEKTVNNGDLFLDSVNAITFSGGQQISSEMNHSGKYSIVLSEKSPYGMTIKIDSVKTNDYFKISTYIHSLGKNGAIVASGENAGDFYKTWYNPDGSDSGWKKLAFDFYIPKEMNNKKLVVYLYNPSQTKAYFDDFSVEWYSYY